MSKALDNKVILNDLISVKRFGAKGNGSTDDTAAVQAAINYALGVSAGVYFPNGKYRINSTVSLKNTVSLVGCGKTASEIYFGASGKFDLTGSPGGEVGRLSIRSLGLTNQGGGPTFCLTMLYATRVLVDDCVIYDTGVNMSAVNYITFQNCDGFGGSIQCDHPTVNSISEAVKFFNINGSNFYLKVKDTADVMVANCSLLGGDSRIDISRGEQPAGFYPPVFISDTVVDTSNNECILLQGVSPRLTNVWVSGGRVNLKDGISMNDCTEGSIVNSTARFCGANGLFLGSCNNMSVVGSIMNDNKNAGTAMNNCTRITFVGNTMGNATSWFGGSYAQTDGLVDNPSNCTHIRVIGNDFTGNTNSATFLPSDTNTVVFNKGLTTNAIPGNDIRPQVDNATSSGTASQRFSNAYSVNFRPGNGTVIWTSGTGTPEGAVTAPVGSLFTRLDGGATTTLYVKTSGTGNTGWTAK